MPIRSVTVYLSASDSVDRVYHDAASATGRAIALAGWTLVYGGNHVGLMGVLADGARSAGGRVVGVTPKKMHELGISDVACDELIVTEDMRTRKAQLETRADAFIALPGGIGTLEEFFEILVGRILGYHTKPIVILNINGYYAPLLAMIEHGIDERFIKPNAREGFFVATSPEEAVKFLQEFSGGKANAAHPEGDPSATE